MFILACHYNKTCTFLISLETPNHRMLTQCHTTWGGVTYDVVLSTPRISLL